MYMIEKRETMRLQGVINASEERQELFLTEFLEKDGFISEECYDLHSILECFNNKNVKIIIEHTDEISQEWKNG